MNILSVRQCIDDIDLKLLHTLGKRMDIVRGIAQLKKVIRDPKREGELMKRWKALAKDEGFSPQCAEDILRAILKESKRIQRSQQ
ncbi:MAG: chorismate mutase [Candidatus Peregrinibacteria bacterium]